MIRFTFHQDGSRTVVGIAGRLQAKHLDELAALSDNGSRGLVIDLAELQHADPESIERLEAQAREGAEIRGASPFISLLLERARTRSEGCSN